MAYDRSFAKKNMMPMLKEIWLWIVKRGGARRDQLLVRVHADFSIDEAAQTPPVRFFIETIPDVLTAKSIN